MSAHLVTIARMEFTAAARLWWIRLFTVAYALLTFSMAYASGVIGESAGEEGFARLTVAVLPLALMLVPLASLLVGTSSGPDAGETAFLLAQPVTRRQFVFGCWLGQAAAISTSVALGLGMGGVLVAAASGSMDAVRLVALIALCTLGALAFLSIGSLISIAVPRRSAAMGIAAFVWFVAVILYDSAMLGVALWLPGTAGARVLLFSVFGNALDLVRVVALVVAGTPHVLGAAGESWLRALGGSTAAIAVSVAAMAAWITVPLGLAALIDARRDR
jgi:ABC-type transport system involved in multi-copper enzyme maturation permease subunit